jgi:hypothetical protein
VGHALEWPIVLYTMASFTAHSTKAQASLASGQQAKLVSARPQRSTVRCNASLPVSVDSRQLNQAVNRCIRVSR